MTATINGLTMYVKHIDTSFALLVDDNDREHKISIQDLKTLYPFNVKRVKTKLNEQHYGNKRF